MKTIVVSSNIGGEGVSLEHMSSHDPRGNGLPVPVRGDNRLTIKDIKFPNRMNGRRSRK